MDDPNDVAASVRLLAGIRLRREIDDAEDLADVNAELSQELAKVVELVNE
jgi:hypothetical protein